MGQGEKRLSINNLVPGEKYAIQVRAIDNGEPSQWSQKYSLTTVDDTAGGTRTPTRPVLDTWGIDGAGHYSATWATNFTNTDRTLMVVKRYELELSADGETHIQPHYVGTGASQSRSFTQNTMRGIFNGPLPPAVTARLRIINSADTPSEWSAPLVATLPVPNPPTNPLGFPLANAIKVTWEPPTDPIHLYGYRVYVSGTAQNFDMDRATLMYEGPATEFTYTTMSYAVDWWFKIVSYSAAGLESTHVEPVPSPMRPISPYGPDDEPPLQPALAAPTMDRTTVTAPKANLAWTIVEAADENKDISGFVVRWRIVGDTTWRNNYFDKAARAGVIDLPRPFANYEFEIAAYDFVANYSAYAGTLQTLTGASAPPAQTTGVDSVPRWDGLRIIWNESTSEAVKFTGGRYEVQLRSTNSFPADTPVEYVTANNFIDVAGLPSLSTWYYRVRAIDSANQAGPWSIVDTETLPAFPVASATDGVAPSAAPSSLRATGGLNYVNLSWPRVTNADEVYYEVYMSTTAGVTAITGNFAGQSSGTSLMVATLPNGNPLLQDTSYYFKVRAVDGDGAGPLSAEANTQLTQVLSTDLGINMGGENLFYNSSVDVDSDANNVANYWTLYNNSAQTEPHTASMPAGRDGVGKAQRITWTGVNTSTKGIYHNVSVLRPNTEYVLSFYARASGGTGFATAFNTQPNGAVAWVENEAPSATVHKRYIAKFTTGATVDPNTVFITIVGNTANGGWVEFDDLQIEAGNLATAYKTGTVSIAKLATGKFETADMIIATGGRIVSQTYLNNANTGFMINDSGVTIKDGAIDAKTLIANTTFTTNLYVGAILEVAAGGAIRSAGYRPAGTNDASDLGTGFRLDSVGFDLRSGTVAVGTLGAGTITSPDIKVGANGKITIDSTGGIQSNNWNPVGPVGWRIDSTGITMDGASKINVNAIESGTLNTTILTIGSGGELRSKDWAANGAVRWQLAETGLTMVGGTITGSTIITDQLYSSQSEVSGGVSRRKFSINASGYAEFTGVYIYGGGIIGNDANSVLQSGNYNGSTGWSIRGNGTANFFNTNTWNLNIYGDAVIGRGDAAGNNYIKSAGYDGQNGWAIRGTGYADFWGGLFVVGGAGGGQIRLTNWGSGESLIQFLAPGDWSKYAYLKAEGYNFAVRGAFGGALIFTADTTVRSSLHHAVDYDIWAGRNINAGNAIGAPTLSCDAFGGNPVFNWVGGSQFTQYAIWGASGRLQRGANNSSREYKEQIKPLAIKAADVLALEPKSFYYNEANKEMGTAQQAGFIAEEANELGLKHWVFHTDGKPTGFNYPMFTVAQQVVLRDHEARVKELEDKVERLLNLLESRS